MDRIKFLSVIVVILLAVNIGTLGYLFISRNDNAPGRGKGGGPSAFIIERLQLDKKQEAEFEALRDSHHTNIVAKRDSLRLLHDDYFKGLETDSPDMAKAAAIAAQIAQKQMEVEMLTFDHFTKVRALCNDDQKKLFDSLIGDVLRGMGGPPQSKKGQRPPRH